MKNLTFILCLLSCLGCSKKIVQEKFPAERLDKMYLFLQGNYTNKAQADTEKNVDEYLMHIAPIWQHLADEHWLYVERYKKNDANFPVSQRVIKLEESLDFLKQQIYSIPKQNDYLGGWQQVAVFDSIGPNNLRKQNGCTVFFKEDQINNFNGVTLGKNCVNRFKGSLYARTDMSVTPNAIRLLEQGFDEKSMYIWGPKNGGYIFEKLVEDQE